MNKYITMLIGALVTMLSFSSCTDQDDIEIAFQHKITLSAENIFKSFYPEKSSDEFEQLRDCKLNLISLVYNTKTGEKVAEEDGTYSQLSNSLVHDFSLPNGEYTLISVARFEGDEFHNWTITGTEKLSTFKIVESDLPDAINHPDISMFETLGFDIKQVKVDSKPLTQFIEISPITALCQIEYHHAKILHRFDGSYMFTNELNRFYGRLDAALIVQPNFCQTLSIDSDGITPIFGFISQETRYLLSSYTFDYTKSPNAVDFTYRALLPHGNKTFKWYGVLHGANMLESATTEQCNGLLNIEAGKQYDISLFFDILFLHACEHDAELTPEKKVAQCIPFLDGNYFLPEEEQ